jgi:hypothetical protein
MEARCSPPSSSSLTRRPLASVSNPRPGPSPGPSPAHFTNPKLAGAQPPKTSLPSTRHGCRALLFFVTSHPTPNCAHCASAFTRLTALPRAQDLLSAVSLVCRRASPRPVHLHIRLASCQHSTTDRHLSLYSPQQRPSSARLRDLSSLSRPAFP